MGGYGSSRWFAHWKKTQVEDCSKLDIYSFKSYLRPGYVGVVRWYRGQRETGSIGYTVFGDDKPTYLKFNYTITRYNDEKIDMAYPVQLTTTALTWGGVRYWFVCPLSVNGFDCNRRVGCLYLPPGQRYYGCRHCYKLTYQSSQEGIQFKGMFETLALSMQDNYPGLTWKDTRAMLERKTTPNLERICGEKFIRDWEFYDPYEHYLTAEQLCEQSGLDKENLRRLEEARLLLPDRPDGRYRPKLAGWGRKLAYLLEEGWEVDEIKRWAKGRWKTENPREWPPDRELFKQPGD